MYRNGAKSVDGSAATAKPMACPASLMSPSTEYGAPVAGLRFVTVSRGSTAIASTAVHSRPAAQRLDKNLDMATPVVEIQQPQAVARGFETMPAGEKRRTVGG